MTIYGCTIKLYDQHGIHSCLYNFAVFDHCVYVFFLVPQNPQNQPTVCLETTTATTINDAITQMLKIFIIWTFCIHIISFKCDMINIRWAKYQSETQELCKFQKQSIFSIFFSEKRNITKNTRKNRKIETIEKAT